MSSRPRNEESFAAQEARAAATGRVLGTTLEVIPGMRESIDEAADRYEDESDVQWLKWIATAPEEEIIAFCKEHPLT